MLSCLEGVEYVDYAEMIKHFMAIQLAVASLEERELLSLGK